MPKVNTFKEYLSDNGLPLFIANEVRMDCDTLVIEGVERFDIDQADRRTGAFVLIYPKDNYLIDSMITEYQRLTIQKGEVLPSGFPAPRKLKAVHIKANRVENVTNYNVRWYKLKPQK